MRTSRALVLGTAVTLALPPLTSHAQVTRDTATMTTDTSLKRDMFLELIVRRWTRSSALRDLSDYVIADSAIELRLWTLGWTLPRGLVLTRSPDGAWRARRIAVPACGFMNLIGHISGRFSADSLHRLNHACAATVRDSASGLPGDVLAVLPVELPSNPDSVWRQVTTTGILSTPSTFCNPESGVVTSDGTLFTLELRRGRQYSFYEVELEGPPDDSTVARVRRVAEILRGAYPWR